LEPYSASEQLFFWSADRHRFPGESHRRHVTPFGHLAIAVLLAYGWGYTDRALALCLAGAVVPDLIDKPLLAAGVVPVSHSVGHSALVVTGLAVAVLALPRLRPAAPLVVGWAGHVGADLIVAYPKFVMNYAWPILEVRPTPDDPFVAYWLEYAAGPLGFLEASLVVAAIVVCYTRWVRPDTSGTDATTERG